VSPCDFRGYPQTHEILKRPFFVGLYLLECYEGVYRIDKQLFISLKDVSN